MRLNKNPELPHDGSVHSPPATRGHAAAARNQQVYRLKAGLVTSYVLGQTSEADVQWTSGAKTVKAKLQPPSESP